MTDEAPNVPTGYFVFSLDTELAWGHFDLDETRAKLFSPDGGRERQAIRRLLDLCDEYRITGTWALVGHLFYECCEDCALCPVKEWEGKYRSFDEAYRTANKLWYGADIVEMVQARGRHEIAFHGYTHAVFDETAMTREAARVEIEEWQRVARRAGIDAGAVVFPRDWVGYLDLLQEAGFTCYRSEEHVPPLLRVRHFYVGPLLKAVDHLLAISTPPIYEVDGAYDSMVNIRASQHLFGFNQVLERTLDRLNLHRLRLRRIARGIHKAADHKKMIHIWAHPWEFRTEHDFDKLRYVFGHVADEVRQGRMQSVGMAELARIVQRKRSLA
jgi:hypothetical protein